MKLLQAELKLQCTHNAHTMHTHTVYSTVVNSAGGLQVGKHPCGPVVANYRTCGMQEWE